MPGMEIIIPVGNIVNTKVMYTSSILEKDIQNLKLIYPFLEIGEIGKSVLNKSIPYIKIGNGNKKVFYSAGFHANEWITSPVLMKFLEDYAKAFVENKNIFGYNALPKEACKNEESLKKLLISEFGLDEVIVESVR